MSFFDKAIKVVSHESKEFQVLSEGVHPAIIVGLVAIEMPDFEDKTILNTKIQLIFQVHGTDVEDAECIKYIASKAISPSLNEKSNLFKLLASPLKVKTPEELAEKFGGELELPKLLGAKFQVVINHNISKDDKTYENITSLIAAKKTDPNVDLEIEVPNFFTKKAFDSQFLDGIKLSEVKSSVAAAQAEIASVTLVGKDVAVAVDTDTDETFAQFKK